LTTRIGVTFTIEGHRAVFKDRLQFRPNFFTGQRAGLSLLDRVIQLTGRYLSSRHGGLQFGNNLSAGGCVRVDSAVYALVRNVVRFETRRLSIGADTGHGSGY